MTKTAVILAGGLGSRLKLLALDTPKCMVRIDGRPFLFWQLSYLKRQGITEFIILTSHLSFIIEKYFVENPISDISIKILAEPNLLGTGGAVKAAYENLSELFWLVNGDTYFPINFLQMENCAKKSNLPVCMAVVPKELQKYGFGNVKLKADEVIAYSKNTKDKSFSYVDGGVYLVSREALGFDTRKDNFDLGEVWESLAQKRKLSAYKSRCCFFDIGTPFSLNHFINNGFNRLRGSILEAYDSAHLRLDI